MATNSQCKHFWVGSLLHRCGEGTKLGWDVWNKTQFVLKDSLFQCQACLNVCTWTFKKENFRLTTILRYCEHVHTKMNFAEASTPETNPTLCNFERAQKIGPEEKCGVIKIKYHYETWFWQRKVWKALCLRHLSSLFKYYWILPWLEVPHFSNTYRKTFRNCGARSMTGPRLFSRPWDMGPFETIHCTEVMKLWELI